MSEVQAEVDRNYRAFERLLPELIVTKRGQYALMHDEKILGFFSTAQDARVAADSFLKGKLYSIQVVDDATINLGFYTDAVVIN